MSNTNLLVLTSSLLKRLNTYDGILVRGMAGSATVWKWLRYRKQGAIWLGIFLFITGIAVRPIKKNVSLCLWKIWGYTCKGYQFHWLLTYAQDRDGCLGVHIGRIHSNKGFLVSTEYRSFVGAGVSLGGWRREKFLSPLENRATNL